MPRLSALILMPSFRALMIGFAITGGMNAIESCLCGFAAPVEAATDTTVATTAATRPRLTILRRFTVQSPLPIPSGRERDKGRDAFRRRDPPSPELRSLDRPEGALL